MLTEKGKWRWFAQSIIDSTPKEDLEDHWVEFSDTVDINIWHDESPIYATAYPIRKTEESGLRYTDTKLVLAILDVRDRNNAH